MSSEGWRALTELIDTECYAILDRLFDLPLAGENGYDMQTLYAYHKGQLAVLRLVYDLEVSIRSIDIEPEVVEEHQRALNNRLADKFKGFYRTIIGAIFRK